MVLSGNTLGLPGYAGLVLLKATPGEGPPRVLGPGGRCPEHSRAFPCCMSNGPEEVGSFGFPLIAGRTGAEKRQVPCARPPSGCVAEPLRARSRAAEAVPCLTRFHALSSAGTGHPAGPCVSKLFHGLLDTRPTSPLVRVQPHRGPARSRWD